MLPFLKCRNHFKIYGENVNRGSRLDGIVRRINGALDRTPLQIAKFQRDPAGYICIVTLDNWGILGSRILRPAAPRSEANGHRCGGVIPGHWTPRLECPPIQVWPSQHQASTSSFFTFRNYILRILR